MDRKYWIGLLNAAVAGAAGGILFVLVDPQDFNFQQWHHLASVCGAFALISLAQYVRDPNQPPALPAPKG